MSYHQISQQPLSKVHAAKATLAHRARYPGKEPENAGLTSFLAPVSCAVVSGCHMGLWPLSVMLLYQALMWALLPSLGGQGYSLVVSRPGFSDRTAGMYEYAPEHLPSSCPIQLHLHSGTAPPAQKPPEISLVGQ